MAKLAFPFRGKIRFTSPFGERTLNGAYDWHNGIDLVALDDKTVRAPCPGIIGVSTRLDKATDKTQTWQWGNYVRLDMADGVTKIYHCHLARRDVVAGQYVNVGDPLGIEGDTGYAFGSHLHFEVRKNGVPVDPCPYLGIENIAGVEIEGEPIPNWYDEAVAWAQANKILKGTGNGQLDLDEPCTRAQMCVFLYRLYNYLKKGE